MGKWIATIVAAVIAGVVVWWITERPRPVDPAHHNSKEVAGPSVSDGRSESHPEIDWTNVETYFLVKKPLFAKGFAQANSKLRFLLKARGTFGGILQAFAFDQDGVKICPTSFPSFGCVSYDFMVTFDNNYSGIYDTYSGGDPRLRLWQEGEAQWAQVFLPHNTARLELNFTQQY